MPVLLWIAVLIGCWCAASVVTALVFGTYLRRRQAATDPHGALAPLAVGPLDLWVDGGSGIDTLAALEAEFDGAPDLDPDLPHPRIAPDRVIRDPETVR